MKVFVFSVASSNNELAPAGANPGDSGLKVKVLVFFSIIIRLTENILVARSNNELAPAGANPLDSGRQLIQSG